MTSSHAAAVVALLVVVAACGGGGVAPPWVEDLEALEAGITSRHIDPFHSISVGEWEAAVERLRGELPHLTDAGAALELRRLVASVGDGHTRLAMDGLLTRYPIVLETVSDGVAVSAATPDHADLVGTVVAAVAGVPVEEAIGAAEAYVSADNAVERRRRALGLVVSPEFLRHAFDRDGPVTVRSDDKEIVTSLEPVPTGVWLSELRGQPAAPYSWARRGDAIIVDYDLCADDPGRPFASFAADVFTAAEGPAVARLVVDLRRNRGGDSSVFDPFLARLAGHRLDAPGRLFVLVGPRTYSSAVLNATALDEGTAAVLVGRPTGGAVNGYGEPDSFVLPNSGLVVEYSTRYFGVVGGPGETLTPDVVVVPSSRDVAAGRDPALEWALAQDG